jgi:hypothetical protein
LQKTQTGFRREIHEAPGIHRAYCKRLSGLAIRCHGTLRQTVTIQDRDQRFRLYRVGTNQPCSVELGDGVRILGDGELIVAPSPSSRGKRRFTQGRAFGEIDIARAPDWLFADLTSAADDGGQAGSKVDGNGESAEDEAKPIRFHPFANLFPMVTREHLEE